VIAAIGAVLGEAGVPASALSIIIHGTTLATNALIERKGARTALITTHGFRDTIEIRHENRFEQYDVGIDLPPPLVPRRLRLTVAERVDAQGRVLAPLDEADVGRAMDEIERRGVEAVAVGLLHSFTEPRHERRIGDMLAARLPRVAVTLSCEVSPEMREYERFSTACANAYLQPLIATYLANLRRDLDTAGIGCPLFLMLSGGGLTTVETAIRFPVRLVESGPAGGAIFASHIARQCGLDQVISFDMGGTTAKICLIDGFKPQTSRVFEVARMYRFKKGSGLPLRIPVIEMVEIGAGGGSIARVDRMKRIGVGPDSAGAEPGPACYGRGGAEPTVTDADLVLGRIDPAAFSGGRMRLDTEAARAALEHGVGRPLDLAPMLAALAVSELVDENMSNAARVHAIECGKDARGRVLIAFGGAAPLHAARVAEKLGMDRILIPTSAGVGSAVGFLRAPIAYEIVRSRLQKLSSFKAAGANALYAEMRAEAEAIVRRGAPEGPLEEERHAFMRYRGQGHEIAVPLPNQPFSADAAPDLRRRFEATYETVFGRAIPKLEVEALTWTLSIATDRPLPKPAGVPSKAAAPPPSGHRAVLDPASGRHDNAALHERAALGPGMSLDGPALIVEDGTTTVVPQGFSARINALGQIVLEDVT
jgi:N-methylhydantoinase A